MIGRRPFPGFSAVRKTPVSPAATAAVLPRHHNGQVAFGE